FGPPTTVIPLPALNAIVFATTELPGIRGLPLIKMPSEPLPSMPAPMLSNPMKLPAMKQPACETITPNEMLPLIMLDSASSATPDIPCRKAPVPITNSSYPISGPGKKLDSEECVSESICTSRTGADVVSSDDVPVALYGDPVLCIVTDDVALLLVIDAVAIS